jgi:DNA polymerase elongation subunit (family B)
MKILFLDIETSPHLVYTWGLLKQDIALNQIVEPSKILCYSAKWYKESDIIFDAIWKSNREKLLYSLYKLLDETDVVVHYNGTSFDIPRINQEFLEFGILPPSPYHEIDLYRTVAKKFGFASNKFEYITKALNIGEKNKTGGMQLWIDVLNGVKDAEWKMAQYNIKDTELLEPTYETLRPWIEKHPNFALYSESEERLCPHCGSHNLHSRGIYHAKTQSYNRYKCNSCGKWSRQRSSILTKEKKANVLVGI